MRLLRTARVPCLLALLSGCAVGARPPDLPLRSAAEAGAATPLYEDLGDHTFPVTTREPLAQRYFDQGLRLYYAFNHAEAIRAFTEAARRDPDCAMCYWGVALAHGPNINAAMEAESAAPAFDALSRALALRADATESERALIDALALRYSPDPRPERAGLDSAYAAAMAVVADAYPGHPEAAVLHAEAIMVLSPWRYWTRGGEPRPQTPLLLERLERVMAADPRHPGACHLFIHAVEEVAPERAVECAERLAALMPGAGHLVHMPGHIYVRVGRYMDAVRANHHAVHADESFIRDQRPGLGIYTVAYYPHNYDFLAFAASMAGRRSEAVSAAERVAGLVPEELLGSEGMGLLQTFLTRPLQIRLRFGDWDGILAAEAPPERLAHARGIWHYARGRAHVATGGISAAASELEALRAILASEPVDELALEFNHSGAILRIAEAVLAGWVAAGVGSHDAAIEHLVRAARLEDDLTYGEPPEWSIPVRHDLGAVLLSAGRAGDAERAHREDLRRFPENGWSLAGLRASLAAQGRRDEAAAVAERLHSAWAHADIPLPSPGR